MLANANPCRDRLGRCASWARAGECSGVVRMFMAEHCASLCGVCAPCGDGTSLCGPACDDQSADCHLWVPERCLDDTSRMARVCPMACGIQPAHCKPRCQTRAANSGCPAFSAPRHLLSPTHARAIRSALDLSGPRLAAFNPTVLSDEEKAAPAAAACLPARAGDSTPRSRPTWTGRRSWALRARRFGTTCRGARTYGWCARGSACWALAAGTNAAGGKRCGWCSWSPRTGSSG